MQLPRTIELTTLRIVIAFVCTMGVSLSYAGPREQAKRIHDRLTGVPPTSTVVDSMAAKTDQWRRHWCGVRSHGESGVLQHDGS